MVNENSDNNLKKILHKYSAQFISTVANLLNHEIDWI